MNPIPLIAFAIIGNLIIFYLIWQELHTPREKYLWNRPTPPEAITPLTIELETITEIAKDAKYENIIPKRSCYRELVDDLLFQRIQATDYPRLKNRLLAYARKNNLELS